MGRGARHKTLKLLRLTETFLNVVYLTNVFIYIFKLYIIYWGGQFHVFQQLGGHMLTEPPIMPLKETK